MSEPVSPTPRKLSKQLSRLLSIDSSRSSTDPRFYEIHTVPEWNYSFWSKIFLIKIAQLIIAGICTGLYSKGLLLMTYSITSLMFPNIVFASFIIITSVILISYILGHVMPDILIRIFNTLGVILYFVSAAITGHFYVVIGSKFTEEDGKKLIYANMLLAQVFLSFFNSALYALDVYFSIETTLKNLENVTEEC